MDGELESGKAAQEAAEAAAGCVAGDAAAPDGGGAAPETDGGDAVSAGPARKKWVPVPKPPKTAEDYAAIAILDRLRSGEGEEKPEGLPLACLVKVLDYTEVPKANEAYAMVSVYGPDDKIWRMCIRRGLAAPGDDMLFVSEDAALPVDDRWRNPLVCTLKEKVYKLGFGIKVRRLLPHVKRNIYHHNNGVLYPVCGFERDLRRARIGEDCSSRLNIDNHPELKASQNAKKVKAEYNVFTPAPAVMKAKAKSRKTLQVRRKKQTRASFNFVNTVRWFRIDAPAGVRGWPGGAPGAGANQYGPSGEGGSSSPAPETPPPTEEQY